jgi:hypothetical protein
VAPGWTPPNRRRSPRIDVLRRVEGRLVSIDAPIVVHDLSRTGFGVLSPIAFRSGETLDFRLTGEDGIDVAVAARAVHSRQWPAGSNLHLTGFEFVPGRLTGLVPQASIDRLIAAVTGPELAYF